MATAQHVWKALKGHPLWATVGSLSLLGVFDFVDRFVSGVGYLEQWFGPDWLSVIAHGTVFKLASLALVIVSLWRIGTASQREHAAAARKKEADRRRDLRPISRLAKHLFDSRRLADANRAQVTLEHAIDGYVGSVDFWDVPQADARWRDETGRALRACVDAIRALETQLGMPETPLAMRHGVPHLTQIEPGRYRYEPTLALNVTWVDQQRANVVDLQGAADLIKQALRDKGDALETEGREIEDAGYGL